MNDLPGLEVAATLEASAAGGAGLSTNTYMPAALDRHVAGVEASYFGGLSGTEEVRVSAWRSLTSDAYWSVANRACDRRLPLPGFYRMDSWCNL